MAEVKCNVNALVGIYGARHLSVSVIDSHQCCVDREAAQESEIPFLSAPSVTC